jgi:hypothetical protein
MPCFGCGVATVLSAITRWTGDFLLPISERRP